MGILILFLIVSIFFCIVSFFSFGIGHYLIMASFTQKAFKRMRFGGLIVNACFLFSMLIVNILFNKDTDKANAIIGVIFIAQILGYPIYLMVLSISAWIIRQKLIVNSLKEILDNYPDLNKFDRIINKCVTEFRDISEKEAKRALKKLINKDPKLHGKIEH